VALSLGIRLGGHVMDKHLSAHKSMRREGVAGDGNYAAILPFGEQLISLSDQGLPMRHELLNIERWSKCSKYLSGLSPIRF
jgi:hypothetical protein